MKFVRFQDVILWGFAESIICYFEMLTVLGWFNFWMDFKKYAAVRAYGCFYFKLIIVIEGHKIFTLIGDVTKNKTPRYSPNYILSLLNRK